MYVEGTETEMHVLLFGDQDVDDDVEWMEDALYQSYLESETEEDTRNVSSSSSPIPAEKHDVQHVRVIAAAVERNKPRRIELILDSGTMCLWRLAG